MLHELARTFHLSPTVFYTISVAVLLTGALAVGFGLNRLLHHWTKKFENTWGELVFALLESLPIPLLLMGALYAGIELLTLPSRYERLASKLILAFTIVVFFYFPAKLVVLFLRRMEQKQPGIERVTQPSMFIIRVVFAIMALIVVLENLGISLTAIWTTLGVGSVAVALALQDTLSNFFSGIYLLADRPVNPGDFIRLDSGQDGFVLRIGWRSTQLRTLANNVIVVPNSTLAKAVITNFSLPETRMALTIPISVSYKTDPAHVEKILLEVVKEATRDGLVGLLSYPTPSVNLIPGFGPSSLDFSLGVHVRQYVDQYSVQSELRKRILARFRQEGIEIPYPTQSVRLDSHALGSLTQDEKRQGGKSDGSPSF
ncbi:MAG TPA: mechanosensitive ion channel family protein [Terriglobia bacterium]|nr:mechanosensitive ion channel family protein [Terriglobia bacterium]